jgi:hypothetical protein
MPIGGGYRRRALYAGKQAEDFVRRTRRGPTARPSGSSKPAYTEWGYAQPAPPRITAARHWPLGSAITIRRGHTPPWTAARRQRGGANQDRGSQVRNGLAAGGRWIRTVGSSTDPLPFSVQQSRLP